jgi:hypothetical protein
MALQRAAFFDLNVVLMIAKQFSRTGAPGSLR